MSVVPLIQTLAPTSGSIARLSNIVPLMRPTADAGAEFWA